jgi:mRNA-degrading endonuclease RelE of RelBE toxin-antitoxin system
MAYRITITEEADAQMRALAVREQRVLEAAILARLRDQPTTLTKAVQRLRPNPLAEFELRVGDLRVLYNVEEGEVVLLVVGRKVGNKLIVGKEEFHGHKDDPSQSPGSGPAGDAH